MGAASANNSNDRHVVFVQLRDLEQTEVPRRVRWRSEQSVRVQKRVKDARQLDLLAPDQPDRILSTAMAGFWAERSNQYRNWMRDVQYMSGPAWVPSSYPALQMIRREERPFRLPPSRLANGSTVTYEQQADTPAINTPCCGRCVHVRSLHSFVRNTETFHCDLDQRRVRQDHTCSRFDLAPRFQRPMSPTLALIRSQMEMLVETPRMLGRFESIMGQRQIPDPPAVAAFCSSALWPDGWGDE